MLERTAAVESQGGQLLGYQGCRLAHAIGEVQTLA